MARRRYPGRANVVRIMIRVETPRCLSAAATSRPLISGISMSVRRTSGFICKTSCNASLPFRAWPTTRTSVVESPGGPFARRHRLIFGNHDGDFHCDVTGKVMISRVPEATSRRRLPRASTRCLMPERPTPSGSSSPQPSSFISREQALLVCSRRKLQERAPA